MNASARSEAVELQVFITAKPATVFRFFSNAEKFRKWMGESSSIVPGAGGELIVRHGPNPPATGHIVEWVPERRIVFTWGHAHEGASVSLDSSRVIITMEPVAEGTRVTLRHEGLPSESDRQAHRGGWSFYLSNLSHVSIAEQFAGRLESIVDGYVEAWNEAEPARRAIALEKVWAERGRFCDMYACVNGREAFNAHIGGTRKMLMGARLERSGAVQQVHSFVRWPWRIVLSGGGVMACGINVMEFDVDSRIRLAVGFWDPPKQR